MQITTPFQNFAKPLLQVKYQKKLAQFFSTKGYIFNN